jgi:penicillin-binding protein 1C
LAEDRHFYSHPGFNPFSVLRAMVINIQNGTVKQGGSTITQQSIRISRQNPSRNLIEKVIELLLAFRWEVWATKDEILQFYTAHTPMGGNTVGYSAACWRYFRKIPSEITWAQAATLAVLPNSPGQIHPGKAREVLLTKRNNLLKKILLSKLIDSAAFFRSINEELIQSPQAFPQLAPHLLQCLAETKGAGKWYSTTISATLQATLSELLDRIRPEKEAKQINNIGLVVVRLKDQRVIAYHGNYPKTVNSPFVDLVRAKRSYGSLLKPFLFATALSDGKITPQGWLEDVPKTYEGSYSPKNFNNKYQSLPYFTHTDTN